MAIEKVISREVRARAMNRCEYCHLRQDSSELVFPIDHILARQHGGETILSNLALCCGRCNQHKGPNIAGIDPFTHQLTRLFNPRTDNWDEHFAYEGAVIQGLTPIGRTTASVLAMNGIESITIRLTLLEDGVKLV
jgi:5-methylcytosine-specific restriction endonuclease McrA